MVRLILILIIFECVTNIIPAPTTQNESDTLILNVNSTVIESDDQSELAGGSVKGTTDEPIKYDGAQLWRISVDTQDMKNVVSELQNTYDATMWNLNGTQIDLFLTAPVLDDARQLLDKSHIPYSVVITDLQREIDNENPSKDEIEQLQNRKGHRLTWSAYHRIEDVHGYLDYLAKTYPDLCSVKSIGNSVEGRPLKVLRISNGNSKNRAIWMDGGIHAREWISPASVTYIINHFIEEWDEQPESVRNIDWYVLPVANPDGYEYTHVKDRLWRKNRNGSGRCGGVDLNRNFGYKWGGQGTSSQPCSEIFRGSEPFSEPETLAQKKFMDESAANFEGFLTFHSYGQYILYPWGYDHVVPPDYKELDRAGREAANKMYEIERVDYSVGSSANLLYPASGASDDWAKSLGIKYSYTVELRDSGRHGFVLPASQIENTAQEALAFVYVIAKAIASH